MADNNELQTSRFIQLGPGSQVDNGIAAFEAAMRTIFKITADSDLSAAMAIGTGPDATLAGTLTLAADPTESLHACTKQYVDNASGVAAAYRCTAVLSDGQLVANGNTDALEWDSVHIEQGGDMWNIATPSRLKCPVSGDYLFTAAILGRGAVTQSADFDVSIRVNGVVLYPLIARGNHIVDTGTFDATGAFSILEPMDAGDYLEVFVYADGENQDLFETSYISWFQVGV